MPLQCVLLYRRHFFYLLSIGSLCCYETEPINITKAALFNFFFIFSSLAHIISERCIIHVIGNMRSRFKVY